MSERDTVRRALEDAIDWQESLADAHCGDLKMYAKFKKNVRVYRTLLRKRYGETARDISDRALAEAPKVSIYDIKSPDPDQSPAKE